MGAHEVEGFSRKDKSSSTRLDKLLWQVLSINVKAYSGKGEFSSGLLGKKKIQKVQIQSNPFLSQTGKDSYGKSIVIFSLEMGTCTVCWLVAKH